MAFHETPSWAIEMYSAVVERTDFTGGWVSRAYHLCHIATRYGMDSDKWKNTFGNYAYDDVILAGLKVAWDEIAAEHENRGVQSVPLP